MEEERRNLGRKKLSFKGRALLNGTPSEGGDDDLEALLASTVAVASSSLAGEPRHGDAAAAATAANGGRRSSDTADSNAKKRAYRRRRSRFQTEQQHRGGVETMTLRNRRVRRRGSLAPPLGNGGRPPLNGAQCKAWSGDGRTDKEKLAMVQAQAEVRLRNEARTKAALSASRDADVNRGHRRVVSSMTARELEKMETKDQRSHAQIAREEAESAYEKILSEMQQLAEAPCKFKESFLASDTSEERRKMLQEQLEARERARAQAQAAKTEEKRAHTSSPTTSGSAAGASARAKSPTPALSPRAATTRRPLRKFASIHAGKAGSMPEDVAAGLSKRSDEKSALKSMLPSIMKAGSKFASMKSPLEVNSRRIFNAIDRDSSSKLDRAEFRKFLMVSKMGAALEKMPLADRQKLSNEMFESIDDDDSATIDFEEFFKFYKDHLEQLVYEEDLEKFNPDIESLHITRWRKAVKSKVIGNEASVAAAVTSMSRQRGKVEISKIMMRGDLEALKAFIDERSSNGGTLKDMSDECFGGTPPIVVAAHYNHLHIVDYLAHHPELDDTLKPSDRKMVSQCCKEEDHERVLALLDGIYADQLQRSQLMSAFLMQDVDSAKNRILQRKHRDRAIRAGEVKRPSHRARQGKLSFVPLVGVSKQHVEFLTAAARGDLRVCKKCVQKKKIDVNCEDENNATPLMHAVYNGNIELVEFLLVQGADVASKDIYKRTPLSIAAQADNVEMMLLLFRYGAGETIFMLNSLGRNPFDLAYYQYTKEILAYHMRQYSETHDGSLLSKYLPSRSNSKGVFSVMDKIGHAARVGDINFLKDAAEYSRDVLHARDQYSMTALMHAVASYQLECAELILQNLIAHSASMRMFER
eukprot:INCI17664.6.p1 GENE.INCI17664.6~~INCI17664.6.p1  ORF type:complete len:870 (-),score=192.12 INCI17664.6:519-3128(-)